MYIVINVLIEKKYIASQLCLKFWSVIQYKVMHQICYCFYCIIKKWSKLSQKTGFLAHFERFFDYTLLRPDKLHTPIFCQIKHLMLWRRRYIVLVNYYCSICGCQVINSQIFLCLMQHPRNVASFGGFLAFWALSAPNMTLFYWHFDLR